MENWIIVVKISEKIPEESTQIYIHIKTTTEKHTTTLTTWVESWKESGNPNYRNLECFMKKYFKIEKRVSTWGSAFFFIYILDLTLNFSWSYEIVIAHEAVPDAKFGKTATTCACHTL